MSRTVYFDYQGNEIEPPVEPPIVTNADRIRQMTDDELFELLWGGICDHIPKCPGGLCSECVHSWLKSTVEEGAERT